MPRRVPRVDRHAASARRPREEARHRGRAPEAREAIEAGFDVIQLEKFPVAAVAEVAAIARGRASPPLIAAEGGVNPAEYVRAGAGLIVTSAPYAAAPRDVCVTITADD